MDAQLNQLLPTAAAAPDVPEASPAARAADGGQTSASVQPGLDLLVKVISLCRDQLPQRLAATRVMVALTEATERDRDFFSAVYRAEAAGRTLINPFPASASAYQVFARALESIEHVARLPNSASPLAGRRSWYWKIAESSTPRRRA